MGVGMNILELDEWIYDKARQSVCEHDDIDYDDNNIATCMICGKDVTNYDIAEPDYDAEAEDERAGI